MKTLIVLIAVGVVVFLLLAFSRDDVDKTAKKAETAVSEIVSRLSAAKERLVQDDKARDAAPAVAAIPPPLDSKSPVAGTPLDPTTADVMVRPTEPVRDSAGAGTGSGQITPDDVVRANKDANAVARRVADLLTKYFGE